VREFAFVTVFHSTFFTISCRPLPAAAGTNLRAHSDSTSTLNISPKGASAIILSVSDSVLGKSDRNREVPANMNLPLLNALRVPEIQ